MRPCLQLGLAMLCAASVSLSVIDVALAVERGPTQEQKKQQKRGSAIAHTALQYVGYPYRWGGSSPSTGFDCSGFVMFVFGTLGLELSHDQTGQLASGRHVALDELLPGDLLIFQNTYRRGPSHSGIYIGDGQFVHAATPRHGVTVSAMSDGYWGPRYYGAARPGQ